MGKNRDYAELCRDEGNLGAEFCSCCYKCFLKSPVNKDVTLTCVSHISLAF
jgi:hypothetical protein